MEIAKFKDLKLRSELFVLYSANRNINRSDFGRVVRNGIRKTRRRMGVVGKKVKDLVDTYNYKTIRYLTDRYEKILIPRFDVRQMVALGNRRGRC